MENLLQALKNYGYTNTISYEKNRLYVVKKEFILHTDSLFFVDVAYRVMHTYIFAISAPKYDLKGLLILELGDYHLLGMSGFAEKFNIEVEMSWQDVVIRRQYGMRKVLKSEFDPKRYILRKGFPDFPSCPYGHIFKMLGYDLQRKAYVRLASSILKEASLQTIEYKE